MGLVRTDLYTYLFCDLVVGTPVTYTVVYVSLFVGHGWNLRRTQTRSRALSLQTCGLLSLSNSVAVLALNVAVCVYRYAYL